MTERRKRRKRTTIASFELGPGERVIISADVDPRALRPTRCRGCGEPIKGETFMLRDEIWRGSGLRGIYCVGCTEQALGRLLEPADFSDAPVNRTMNSHKSPRLRARLGLPDLVEPVDRRAELLEFFQVMEEEEAAQRPTPKKPAGGPVSATEAGMSQPNPPQPPQPPDDPNAPRPNPQPQPQPPQPPEPQPRP